MILSYEDTEVQHVRLSQSPLPQGIWHAAAISTCLLRRDEVMEVAELAGWDGSTSSGWIVAEWMP